MGRLSTNEFDVLIKAKDARTVPALLDALQTIRDSYYAGALARALGELGDKRAVEPLIQTLLYAEYVQEDVPRALGKLKDPRAIEPLRKTLARFSAGESRRNAVLHSLLMLEAPGILEQLADEIQKNRNSYEAQQTLQAMGKYGGNRAIQFIQPSLDDPHVCAAAAQALAELGTPAAWAALTSRLAAQDYRYARNVFPPLVQRLGQICQACDQETRRQRMWQMLALGQELTTSANPATRAVATDQMRWLEQRLAEEELQEFQARTAAGEFDAAEQSFQAALAHPWAAIQENPGLATVLLAYLDPMLCAYVRRGESQRAVTQLETTLALLPALAKGDSPGTLTLAGLEIRGRRLLLQLAGAKDADPQEVRQLLAALQARRAAQPEPRSLSPELSLTATLARALELSDQGELAVAAYRTLAELAGSGPGGASASMKQLLEGAVRRAQLPGQPLPLAGTRIDGAAWDWSAYRGKVVLVEFWASWCQPWRAALPRLKDLYARCHDRGFEVVGVSLDHDRAELARFLDGARLPWTVLHDLDGDGRRPLATLYGIATVPVAILVDREGKVASLPAGGEELERLLPKLLGPPKPGTEEIAPAEPASGYRPPAWALETTPVPDMASVRRMESVTRDGKEPDADLSLDKVPAPSWPPPIALVSHLRTIPVVRPDVALLNAQISKLGAQRLTAGFRSSWAPDGKRLVYGKTGPSDPAGFRGLGLAVLDTETGKTVDLTDAGKDPAWSGKDGRFIAYVTGNGTEEELWIIEATGKNLRKADDGGYPSWSADGQTLFFHSRRQNKLMAIELRGDDLSAPQELADVPCWYPAISADGKRVACRQGRELVIATLGPERKETRYPLPVGNGFLGGWSPDGKQFAFGGWGSDDPSPFQVLDVASGRTVFSGPQWLTLPAWSPDGTRLSFDVRSRHGFEIWLIETKALSAR